MTIPDTLREDAGWPDQFRKAADEIDRLENENADLRFRLADMEVELDWLLVTACAWRLMELRDCNSTREAAEAAGRE